MRTTLPLGGLMLILGCGADPQSFPRDAQTADTVVVGPDAATVQPDAGAVVGLDAAAVNLDAGAVDAAVGDAGQARLFTLITESYLGPNMNLHMANESLFVAPATDQSVQTLTMAMSGPLLSAYTRLPCHGEGTDPNFGLDARAAMLPSVTPVHLIELGLDFVSGNTGGSHDGAVDTCFSYRARGVWHTELPLRAPASADGVSRGRATLDATDVDAIVIFMNGFADVSRVVYRVGP